ncbi:MAG: FAD-dependent oxidoreductase, partial [Thiomargarita sp.]|nr:FAD-dependent oxidoreductase [Thiomargarita sp.]
HYYTCFMSNEVLGGDRTLESIKFSYDGLQKYGITLINSQAIAIDTHRKTVRLLERGRLVTYDRLIVSPGIDFRWDVIKGYTPDMIEKMPHAWKAGPQTLLLRQQLEAMKDGGTVMISVPPKPYRCPVAPYERASQIAHYLKHHKPKSKVLILDANQAFGKQALFMQGWEQLYGFGTEHSLIEWIPLEEGGNVFEVNAHEMRVYAGEFEDVHTADVINIIPPQKAGNIAYNSGLVDETGWCPINQKTFESTLQKDIYVIGDASITIMPKSAYAANSQAKVCVDAIVADLQGREMGNPSYINTCYSIVGTDFGISTASIYHFKNGHIQAIEDAGGASPLDASAEYRKREMVYAYSWFKNMTYDMFQ